LTPAEIVKVFQDRVDVTKAAAQAEAARTSAVKAERDKRDGTNAFAQSFRRMVVGMFSQSPDTLAKFGIKAPKAFLPQAKKPTVATKSAALVKTKATRAQRKTMGTKQKKVLSKTAPTPPQGEPVQPLPKPTV
jgi:hypothetical protein